MTFHQKHIWWPERCFRFSLVKTDGSVWSEGCFYAPPSSDDAQMECEPEKMSDVWSIPAEKQLLERGITFVEKTERRIDLHLNTQHLSALTLSAGIPVSFAPFAFYPNCRSVLILLMRTVWRYLQQRSWGDIADELQRCWGENLDFLSLFFKFLFCTCCANEASISAPRERTGRVASAEWRLCTARYWSAGGGSPPLCSTSPTGFQLWWDWREETQARLVLC